MAVVRATVRHFLRIRLSGPSLSQERLCGRIGRLYIGTASGRRIPGYTLCGVFLGRHVALPANGDVGAIVEVCAGDGP